MCPHCHSHHFIKHGRFKGFGQQNQRYRCRNCGKTFHLGRRTIQQYDRRGDANRPLLYALCSGVSQRRTALLLSIKREAVARKIRKYGPYFRQWHEKWIENRRFGKTLLFDEMETFEHTKCKPLSIAIAVEERSRIIISTQVSSMPAKGKLAAVARKRYGLRVDRRPEALQEMMRDMLRANSEATTIKSDKAPRYPKLVAKNYPGAEHKRFKGRRGCVVGQGELKAGGHDPLFYLNHTCAMIRDNLKRMSRRTWCTSKKPEQLQNLLHIYTVFHNRWLDGRRCLTAMLEAPPPATILGAS